MFDTGPEVNGSTVQANGSTLEAFDPGPEAKGSGAEAKAFLADPASCSVQVGLSRYNIV